MREKDSELGLPALSPPTPSFPSPSPSTQEKEKDADLASTTSTSTSSSPTPTSPYLDKQTPNFEPIRSTSRRFSISTTRSHKSTKSTKASSLRRERSNNGYGCDDLIDDDLSPVDHETPSPQEHTDEEHEKFPFEVTFTSPLDPSSQNPRNMPPWRKWLIIGLTSFGSFAVTNASAVYTATYTQMTLEFSTTRLIATLGLSTFVLGIALGPFWSPLAEFYGRRPIYLVSFFAFIIWLIPSAVATNITTMIVARFFQGLAGSAFLSVSGGTVGDLFSREEMQLPMAVFTIAPFVGPSTGPLIGGLTNTHLSWRWTHYIVLIESVVIIAGLYFLVPETYHPVLLVQKAERVRERTGEERWFAPLEKLKAERSVLGTIKVSIARPVQILIHEPMCLILDIYSAILLGMLYLFFGAFPLVFSHNHGFNLWQVGLTFMGLLLAMPLAALSTPYWHRVRERLAEKRAAENGGEPKGEPEDVLPMVVMGAPLITGGLFWFGFTSTPAIHWMVPIAGSFVFGFGTMLAFTGIFTFLVDAYPRYAASALAGNALVRCSFAAAFPLFGIQMYEGFGYQWATGLLAFLTLAMLPFPYVFFKYGKRIRAKSRFATAS